MPVSSSFRSLHRAGRPLLMPNPWDAGSARLLASLGYEALATTSSGFAATIGRQDGGVTREQALDHAARIVEAVTVPVSADLEDGFGVEPAAVAGTIAAAVAVGLAGCSVEDYTRDQDHPIYDLELAVERIAAAAAAAPEGFVLTARCENHLYGQDDLTDTVARLQRYHEAGADVVYAPGLRAAADIATVVREVDAPVNVLLLPGTPSVAELADLGVARISLGGTFAWVAYGAMVEAARSLLQDGRADFFDLAGTGRAAAETAFVE